MTSKERLEQYSSKSPKLKELFALLEEKWNDDLERGEEHKIGTLLLILMRCDTDEKCQKMIDILNNHNLSSDDMTEVAWQIHDGLEPEFEDE